MDELKKFREEAKNKYEKFRQEKEAAEAAKIAEEIAKQAEIDEAIEAQRLIQASEDAAKSLKFSEESENIDVFFIELDESINELKASNDIFLVLQMIHTRIQSVIEIVREHNRLPEIQDRVLVFIEIMNKTHADSSKKKDPTYVSQVSNIVKSIFELCEVDVKIEGMDTSEDDEIARKLQEQMYTMNFFENEIVEDDNLFGGNVNIGIGGVNIGFGGNNIGGGANVEINIENENIPAATDNIIGGRGGRGGRGRGRGRGGGRGGAVAGATAGATAGGGNAIEF